MSGNTINISDVIAELMTLQETEPLIYAHIIASQEEDTNAAFNIPLSPEQQAVAKRIILLFDELDDDENNSVGSEEGESDTTMFSSSMPSEHEDYGPGSNSDETRLFTSPPSKPNDFEFESEDSQLDDVPSLWSSNGDLEDSSEGSTPGTPTEDASMRVSAFFQDLHFRSEHPGRSFNSGSEIADLLPVEGKCQRGCEKLKRMEMAVLQRESGW
ncbi:hypothetical protein BJ508DRAFT_303534 [Ascobolus immersus RN42]|uniref:Uncharacterized protein n=1 Tax=Ascobolus immersus RN42 TaxID=1160509 RepID=A0A3N4IF53_ASCIM|nr:hypothetical protein BJ508DRAFT_303534 [Ascobolus immersus RN42]